MQVRIQTCVCMQVMRQSMCMKGVKHSTLNALCENQSLRKKHVDVLR